MGKMERVIHFFPFSRSFYDFPYHWPFIRAGLSCSHLLSGEMARAAGHPHHSPYIFATTVCQELPSISNLDFIYPLHNHRSNQPIPQNVPLCPRMPGRSPCVVVRRIAECPAITQFAFPFPHLKRNLYLINECIGNEIY